MRVGSGSASWASEVGSGDSVVNQRVGDGHRVSIVAGGYLAALRG